MNSQSLFSVRIALALLLMFLSPASTAQDDTAEAVSEPRATVVTGINADAIASRWSDSVLWLTSDEAGKQLSLFQPEVDVTTRGAIVVLGDEGQSAASELANGLREALSQKGWGVLTLGLEPPPFEIHQALHRQNRGMAPGVDAASDSEAEEASSVMIDVIESTQPVEGLAEYRARIRSSLTAAVNQLSDREYERIVLLGIGWAAGHVTRQALEDGRTSDMVWVTPRFHSDESADLAELLSNGAAPSILELYSTFPGNRLSDRTAEERAAALKRAGIEGYRRQPVAVSHRPQAREANTIANRVSAWLVSDRKRAKP